MDCLVNAVAAATVELDKKERADVYSAQPDVAGSRPKRHEPLGQPPAIKAPLGGVLGWRRNLSHLLEQIIRSRGFRLAGCVLDVEFLDDAILNQHGVTLGAHAESGT